MPTFDTPAPVKLSIELEAGEVVIDATTTASTDIELRPARPGDEDAIALIAQTKVEHSGDTVVVHVPGARGGGLFRRTPEIVITARMPVGSTLAAKLASADLRVTGELEHVRVDTASGDATIADVSGSAVILAASGDIKIGTIGGDLRVKSASGDVEIDTCCADCSVQTASGDIALGTVEGDLDVKTASGDIRVGAADASVRARTASGEVELGHVRTGKVAVETVSGEVAVAVERGTSVWLDVSSLSGTVDSALEAADAAADGARKLELRVRTVSGGIHLTPA